MFMPYQEVLEEIEEERQKQDVSGEEVLVDGGGTDNGIVLVACKDERSRLQLEECIVNGPKKVFLSLHLILLNLFHVTFPSSFSRLHLVES